MSQQMSTKTWIMSLIQDLVENLPTKNGGLNPKPNKTIIRDSGGAIIQSNKGFLCFDKRNENLLL